MNAKTFLCVGGATLLGAANLLAAFDFTPRYAERDEDGLRVRSMFITDGAQKVFLDPPFTWEAKGGGPALMLQNPKYPQASIQLRESGAAPVKKFDEEWVKAVSETLLRTLPPDSQDGAIIRQIASPIGANGWKSFAVVAGYNYFGQRMNRAQCTINLNATQALEIVCTAQEKDLPTVFNQAIGMMSSWYVIRTGPSTKSPSPSPAPAAPGAIPAKPQPAAPSPAHPKR
jgi:hypothetical protein